MRGAETQNALRIRRVKPGAAASMSRMGRHGVIGIPPTPQHMPEELLAAMPPILQASMEAGSGPILRPKNASRRLASPPIMAARDPHHGGGGIEGEMAKAFAETDQHRIRDRLSRQGGASGAKVTGARCIAAKGENGGRPHPRSRLSRRCAASAGRNWRRSRKRAGARDR